MVSSDFFVALLLWFARALVSSFICLFIGYLAIRGISHLTTRVNEFENIRGHPLATGLFVSGFLIFSGLVVHGSMVNPFFLAQSILVGAFFNFERLLIVLSSSVVSLVLGWTFYLIFARFTPFGVDLHDIDKNPVAVGVFLFGYEVFLGLVMYASLMIPLG